MPEVKTIECFSEFFVVSDNLGLQKAILKSGVPKIEEGSQIIVFLEVDFNEGEKSLEKFLYEDCSEGDLLVGVKGEENFSFNLEDGELVMVCPENYDFSLRDGELIMSRIPEGFLGRGIGYWRIEEDFVVQ